MTMRLWRSRLKGAALVLQGKATALQPEDTDKIRFLLMIDGKVYSGIRVDRDNGQRVRQSLVALVRLAHRRGVAIYEGE